VTIDRQGSCPSLVLIWVRTPLSQLQGAGTNCNCYVEIITVDFTRSLITADTQRQTTA
jgi:hypothetical protein